MKSIIEKHRRCGWILTRVIEFNDSSKSANYFFVSKTDPDYRVIYWTEGGAVKRVEVQDHEHTVHIWDYCNAND